MNKIFSIFLFISLVTFPLKATCQTKRSFTLNDITKLANMSKEDAHIWLTNDEFFTFIENLGDDFKGGIANLYGMNYNISTEEAWIYVVKYYKSGKLAVQGKRSHLQTIINELKPFKKSSNLDDNGNMLSEYVYKSFRIYLNLTNDGAATIDIFPI
ncbi:hypothetical protein [Eudoraea adriatica]|uniref:hypothetical protein n=1 Tax=Eudoraea adriatica TaxID=446681 RepID=UPI00037776DE|nr:hypothetical protein [Eudoraea adriatica]